MNIHNASLLLLTAALLSPWQVVMAESYMLRLYDPTDPAMLLNRPNAQFVSGTANYNIDRTPGVALASQGTCLVNPGAMYVTELTVKLESSLTPVTFTGNLNPNKCRTQSRKPVNYATPDGKACLDNGVNLGWVQGNLEGWLNGQKYTITFTGAQPTNGCAAGNDEPIFLRTYTIKRGARTLMVSGRYANPDAIHALPEPSSYLLLLAGVPALFFFTKRRSRRSCADS